MSSLLSNAFFRSKLQLQPIETGDAASKVAAETALRWMLFQHAADDLRREVELVAQYQEMYGLGIMAINWRRTTRTERKTITLDEFQAMLAETGDPMIQILLESILDPLQEADAVRMLKDLVSPAAGKVSVIRDLRNTGAAEYDNPYIFGEPPGVCRPRALGGYLFPRPDRRPATRPLRCLARSGQRDRAARAHRHRRL
jgi:hypothetical protein